MALVVVAAILVSGVAGVGWIMLVGERQEVIAPEPAGGDDASLYRLAAMINDPDGYTNVRADPSTYTAIVARVNAGEVFTTCKLTGAFWQVPTADGVTGYMARSRVRLVRDGFPVPPSAPVHGGSGSPSPGDDWADAAPGAGDREG